MHVIGLTIGARSMSALSKNDVMRGTITIMVPSMTNLTNSATLKEGHNPGGIKAFSHDLKRVRWPINFKSSGIEKYDESTNPAKWLKVYQLAIEATGRDSYVMANYLPICLSSLARTWLLVLPSGSVCSWTHICRLFNSNFHAICACPGVEWDLASIIQKKGESL
jgi:hypothetical protein